MGGHTGTDDALERTGVRRLFATRIFVVLYLAETQSIVGDQLARVALSVLVFQRTGSATATAVTYAATFLPAILGGVLLARVGDRVGRRTVMVASDVLRAGCFLAMATLSLSLGLLIALVVVAVAVGPVFSAAQVSALSARLPGETFTDANGIRLMSGQAAQVLGFGVGGVVVAAIGPHGALAVDAATFAVSALLVLVFLRAHDAGPSPVRSTDDAAAPGRPEDEPAAAAFRLLADRRLRTLLVLSAAVGLVVVPEGLTVPFGASVGAGTAEVGVLFAAGALGGALGAGALVRLAPARRDAAARAMSVLCGVPLVLAAAWPHWAFAAVCWLLSGAGAAYVVRTSSLVIQAVPEQRRAHYVGVVGSTLLGGQGLAVVVAGWACAVVAPVTVIAVAGGLACTVALVCVGQLQRTDQRGRHHQD